MEKEFWDEKWLQRQIGFHQSRPHKQLEGFFNKRGSGFTPTSAFVPLCGKTLDLIWLGNHCTQVTGIEFNQSAIMEFFKDNRLEIEEDGIRNGMPFYRNGNITIIEGDIFDFSPTETFDFIYDRAAIVALDPITRKKYAQKISKFSSMNSEGLVITFEYDQTKISGPPFSVPEEELRQIFSPHFEIDIFHQKSETPKSPRFVEANIDKFQQKAFHFKRRNS